MRKPTEEMPLDIKQLNEVGVRHRMEIRKKSSEFDDAIRKCDYWQNVADEWLKQGAWLDKRLLELLRAKLGDSDE